ncbi:MAG: DUF1573 domain-containing protein [Planctomycetes bacterium]|nr:DUF1573 domain-containing protein [Planctomycetota bacterium]
MNKVHLLPCLLMLALASCGSDSETGTTSNPNPNSTGADRGQGTSRPTTLESTSTLTSDETSQPSTSELNFEYLDLDLGELFQETNVDISFPFVVKGDDPITISHLKASCGCTDVGLSVEGQEWPLNTPIPGGSKGAIVGTFTSAQYQNVKASTITIRGNGLKLPAVLNLQAFIRRHFELSPSAVRFGQVSARSLATSPYTKKVKIMSSEEMEIKAWKRLPSGIDVKVLDEREVAEDGRHVSWIEISINEQHGAGMVSQSLLASTSVGRDLEIHINGNIVGPVRYAPQDFLKFGAVNQGMAIKRVVKIISTSGEETLPTPTVDFIGPDVFEWKLQEKEPGREWVVRFTLSSEAAIGRHGGKLKISFPEGTGITPHEVKVSALVRKAP